MGGEKILQFSLKPRQVSVFAWDDLDILLTDEQEWASRFLSRNNSLSKVLITSFYIYICLLFIFQYYFNIFITFLYTTCIWGVKIRLKRGWSLLWNKSFSEVSIICNLLGASVLEYQVAFRVLFCPKGILEEINGLRIWRLDKFRTHSFWHKSHFDNPLNSVCHKSDWTGYWLCLLKGNYPVAKLNLILALTGHVFRVES